MDSTGKRGRLHIGKGGQAKRTSLDVGESMSGLVKAKALQDDLESLGITRSQAKSEMVKKVRRRVDHHLAMNVVRGLMTL